MQCRNIQRIKINIHEKELCVMLVVNKDYTERHGKQNIKFQFYINGLNIKYNIEHNNQILCYKVFYQIMYCSTLKAVLGNTTRY
jgi:hypothetical protein